MGEDQREEKQEREGEEEACCVILEATKPYFITQVFGVSTKCRDDGLHCQLRARWVGEEEML